MFQKPEAIPELQDALVRIMKLFASLRFRVLVAVQAAFHASPKVCV
jgi:hypothetical protein